MKKKILTLMIALGIGVAISTTTVKAENLCEADSKEYVNKNGVQLTEKEYNFVNEFYGEDYFENMTMENYEFIKPLDINSSSNIEIKSVTNENQLNPLSTEVGTPNEKITIAKNCPFHCVVMVSAKWLVNPAVRSYDVIGARLVGTNLATDLIATTVTSTSGIQDGLKIKKQSNGFGVSVKLPDAGLNIYVDQRFDVDMGGGTVYASYQHAIRNTTLDISQMFNIRAVYGNVFDFYGSATDRYDAMLGVSISV